MRYLEVFNLILSIVVYAPRSMILQAESKREYEEVSVNESVWTAVFDLLYWFTSSSQRYLLEQVSVTEQ